MGNWEVWNGTSWYAATVLPTVADYVNLNDIGIGGYTITIDQAGALAATCSGIDINRINSYLLLTTGGDFTVNGRMSSGTTPAGGIAGLFEMNGGTAHISGFRHTRWNTNGGFPATIKISGGTLLPTYRTNVGGKIVDAGYRSGTSSTRGGILHIVGTGASITMLGGESSEYGAWELGSYGILIAELDGTEKGISTIVCDTSVSANLYAENGDNAAFSGGKIDIMGTAPTLGASFTLLTADYINDVNVTLDISDQRGNTTPEWAGNYWKLIITRGTESGLGNSNNSDNGSVVIKYLAPATFLYWDTNGTTPGIGGTGNWDTLPLPANTNWSQSADGTGPMVSWDNANADTTVANFTQAAAGETVTLTEGISASEIEL